MPKSMPPSHLAETLTKVGFAFRTVAARHIQGDRLAKSRRLDPVPLLLCIILIAPQSSGATMSFRSEIAAACGTTYESQVGHLLIDADGAETAGDREKEEESAIQAVELANACLINLREVPDDAQLWVRTDVLSGLAYRMASADLSDHDLFWRLIAQMAYQLSGICEMDRVADADEPGKRAHIFVKAELERMMKFTRLGKSLSDTPYAPYLDTLRSCATKVGFEKSF